MRLYDLNTCTFFKQADQHQDLGVRERGVGGGGGRVLYDLLGRSVLCNPRTLSLYHSMFYCNFATLAILDVCLCNMWPKKKANEKSLHFVS